MTRRHAPIGLRAPTPTALLALTLPALLALTLTACHGFSKLDYTTLGRASWQRPDRVVEALQLRPGDRVADLGAGEGFFVPYLANAVGPGGRVYAVEVERELTDRLAERFAAEANVEIVLGGFDDPALPDGAVDLVLIVNTYHHIEERATYFRRLKSDLGPRGRVAVIEPNAELSGLLSLFVEEGHNSVARSVGEEMRSAGYRHVVQHDLLPVQIFEVFEPDADAG
jgi:arsenite methyltransferase